MIGNDVLYAAKLLKQGDVVAIPTETVYGLAANAFNPTAIAKIFEIKQRPSFNPLIVHVKDLDSIFEVAENIDERLMQLIKRFSPGPLSILVPKKSIIPDIVTAESPYVVVRIPNHPLTLNLLKLIDFPIAAPSANPYQYISPTSPLHVQKQLGNKIPYILDGGTCKVGIESTIVGIENNKVVIYRLGGISIEAIEETIGQIELKTESKSSKTPGQADKHYAPKKKIVIGNIKELVHLYSKKNIAVILFGNHDFISANNTTIYNLSETANLLEAASCLFNILHQIENSDADIIITELLPNMGLGKAINDRLLRASK